MTSLEDWDNLKIGDLIASSCPGEWGEESTVDAGIPVIRSTNFRDDGSLDLSDLAYRKIPAARLEPRRVTAGTVLIEKSGGSSTRPAGRVVFCEHDFDGTASNFVEIVRVKATLSPKYVFYRLYHNFHSGLVYKYQQQTTGIINFKFGEYCEEAVSIPVSQPEQVKIAEALSTVDWAIEQTEALTAKQQRIKTGLMQDLLTRGIDEHGNLRSEATHEFKDSPLRRIPVEWGVIDFGDVGDWFSGGTPSKANSRFWNGGVPWVCPKDMKQFELSSSIDTITEHAVATGARLMPKGTVFIVIRGMILAHTFPVGYTTREVAFNQDVKAIVTKAGLDGRFLAYWLVSHSHEFLKLATTATHGTKRFDMDELRAIPIGVPQPDEQKAIIRVFDEQQVLIDETQAHAHKLQSLKAGLMQDLLTGDRRVTALLKKGRRRDGMTDEGGSQE